MDIKRSRVSVAPLVRQSQSLQLCAMMTINNLLQLSPDKESNQREGETENLILCGSKLFLHDALPFTTKSELNDIADVLTLREAELFHCGDDKNSGLGDAKISYWKMLQSHHRTPLLGNYSVEVLEAALLNRNIKLEWFTDVDAGFCDNGENTNSLTIGFVINSIQPFSIKNAITSTFGSSRHWWTITRLRRVKYNGMGINEVTDIDINSTLFIDSRSGNQIAYHGDEWNIVNSSSNIIKTVNSEEMQDFLREVITNQGKAFRATMLTVNKPY